MRVAEGVRVAVRTIGELLITGGLVLLLFAAYLLWGTNLKTAAAQDDLRAELRRAWAAADPAPAPADPGPAAPLPAAPLPAAPPPPGPAPAAEAPAAEAPAAEPEPAALPGDAYALLVFPTLGAEHVVVEGVAVDDLRKGPGHYPGTAAPGEVGNVVISGHRTTYGAPFGPVGELAPGDPVVLETAGAVHTYRVTGLQVVAPTAIEVTYPVPGEPGATPTERLLTLTTCHPRYSAEQRLIVRAVLDATVPRGTAGGGA